jgi:hypothetical protein
MKITKIDCPTDKMTFIRLHSIRRYDENNVIGYYPLVDTGEWKYHYVCFDISKPLNIQISGGRPMEEREEIGPGYFYVQKNKIVYANKEAYVVYEVDDPRVLSPPQLYPMDRQFYDKEKDQNPAFTLAPNGGLYAIIDDFAGKDSDPIYLLDKGISTSLASLDRHGRGLYGAYTMLTHKNLLITSLSLTGIWLHRIMPDKTLRQLQFIPKSDHVSPNGLYLVSDGNYLLGTFLAWPYGSGLATCLYDIQNPEKTKCLGISKTLKQGLEFKLFEGYYQYSPHEVILFAQDEKCAFVLVELTPQGAVIKETQYLERQHDTVNTIVKKDNYMILFEDEGIEVFEVT